VAARKPLVQIAGVVNELPAGDTLDGVTGGSSTVSNVVAAATTIAADTSVVIVSYLKVQDTLTVSGNLLITG
jgi:hypothetical protein